jgi:hypothetical protein
VRGFLPQIDRHGLARHHGHAKTIEDHVQRILRIYSQSDTLHAMAESGRSRAGSSNAGSDEGRDWGMAAVICSAFALAMGDKNSRKMAAISLAIPGCSVLPIYLWISRE